MKKIYCIAVSMAVTLMSLAAPPSPDAGREKSLPQGTGVKPSVAIGNVGHPDAPGQVLPMRIPSVFETGQQVIPSPGFRVPMRAVPHTNLRGVIVGSSAWDPTDPLTGDYSLSAYTPDYVMLKKMRDLGTTNGICHFDHCYWVTVYENILGVPFITGHVYDDTTYEELGSTGRLPNNYRATSMVYDPVDKVIYGSFLNESDNGFEFGYLDPESLQRVRINTLPFYLYGLAILPDGRMVGLNPRTGTMYRVNKESGMLTPLSESGITSDYATSGAVDPKSGRYYFARLTNDESALYTINVDTGEATKLFDYANSEEIMGLWVPMPPHADKAPSAAKSVALTPKGNELAATLAVGAPSTFFDASKGSGTLTMHYTVDDAAPVDSVIGWGEEYVDTLSFATSGVHKVVVWFETGGQSGPETKVEKFVGGVRPDAVTEVTLSRGEGSSFTITWTASTTTSDEGQFVPGDVAYKIVRSSDSRTVAENVKGLTYTDVYPEPSKLVELSYSVIPTYNGIEGEATGSEAVIYGYMQPPVTEKFASSRKAIVKGAWTVIDENGDGAADGWTHDYSAGRLRAKKDKLDIYATPRVYLEADKLYTLKFGVGSYSSSKTAIIGAGISDRLEPKTFRTVIEPKEVKTESKTKYEYLEGDLAVDSTGFYYIGLINAGGTGTSSYVDNFEIKAPSAKAAPDAPASLAVTPDAHGSLEAEVSFTVPETSIAGDTLTALSKVVVKRGNKVVKTFTEGVTPGCALSCVDTPEEAGAYTYSVAAYNTSGEGRNASATVYVGVNIPGNPSKVLMSETSPGEVMVSWEAPAVDADGYPITPELITYNVYASDGRTKLAEGLTDRQYSWRPSGDGDRGFVRCYVQAVTKAGEAPYIVSSNQIPYGKPYEVPFAESFADAKVTTLWGLERLTNGDASWTITPGSQEIQPQDGDGGFVMFFTSYAEQQARLSTAKIHVPDDRTALSLYYYSIPGCTNRLDVQAGTPVDFTTLKQINIGETDIQGWTKVTVPLGQYAGRDVSLALLGTSVNSSQIHVDNVTVRSMHDIDLTAVALKMPARIKPGAEVVATLTVENSGLNSVSDYRVELTDDRGEVLATAPGVTLASGEAAVIALAFTPGVGLDGRHQFTAKVILEADEDGTDNQSSAVAEVAVPYYPVAGEAAGTYDGEAVTLTWGAPAPASATPVMDDVEEYEPFSTGLPTSVVEKDNVGAWTMIDCDDVATYGIGDGTGGVIQYPNVGNRMAFMVLNQAQIGLNMAPWAGAENSAQLFASFSAVGKANDDWLVSPLLSGQAQQVSFHAKSAIADYPESFEVLVSTTDTDPSHFTRIASVKNIGDVWKEYTYDIEAGVRYFAVRCVSDDMFALMVDNLKFEADNPYPGIELLGYNVYRDGALITAVPVTGCMYLDTKVERDSSYKYQVSAVYNYGESRLNSPLTLSTVYAGVGGVSNAVAKVLTSPGHLAVVNADGQSVSIYNAQGIKVAGGIGDGGYTLRPGVYVATVGASVFKVTVPAR